MATPPRPRTLALLGLTGVALALLLLGWLTGRSDRPRGLQPSPAAREAQAERSPLRAPPSASATTPREVREAAVASAPAPRQPAPYAGPTFEVLVLDGHMQPVPTARVELRWSARMSSSALLQEGPVDEQGRWTGLIPERDLPEPLELRRRELLIEARAPGHASAGLVRELGSLYSRRLPVTIELRPGRDLRGRVLDARGRPVAGCGLWLELLGTGAGGSGVRVSQADSASDGSFEMSVPQLQGRARIGAFSRSAGRARTPEFELAGEFEHELVLDPGAVLAGRVSFPDGRPAPGLHVLAVSRSNAAQQASVRSDDVGRFTLAALEPGAYVVTAGPESEPPLRGSAHRAETQTPDHSLALVADQVVLEVRLRTSAGDLLRAADVSCRRVDQDEDGILQIGPRSSASTSGSPPRARFVLSPGARYLLVGDVPRCHPAQRLVRAQDLAGLQELDLTVYALEQVAGLRPQFTGLGPGELEHVRIDLHDPYSRLCVKPGLELDEQGTLQLLVPGPWILHARRADSALSVLLPPGVGARVDLRPALESPVWLIVD